mmetsp:Transcript_42524/g.117347  ORF Transcript_42524/g.117347 Transcript_42524/m.117347 type:complete len:254 (-) Transcript_42524:290-1051(-)
MPLDQCFGPHDEMGGWSTFIAHISSQDAPLSSGLPSRKVGGTIDPSFLMHHRAGAAEVRRRHSNAAFLSLGSFTKKVCCCKNAGYLVEKANGTETCDNGDPAVYHASTSTSSGSKYTCKCGTNATNSKKIIDEAKEKLKVAIKAATNKVFEDTDVSFNTNAPTLEHIKEGDKFLCCCATKDKCKIEMAGFCVRGHTADDKVCNPALDVESPAPAVESEDADGSEKTGASEEPAKPSAAPKSEEAAKPEAKGGK